MMMMMMMMIRWFVVVCVSDPNPKTCPPSVAESNPCFTYKPAGDSGDGADDDDADGSGSTASRVSFSGSLLLAMLIFFKLMLRLYAMIVHSPLK